MTPFEFTARELERRLVGGLVLLGQSGKMEPRSVTETCDTLRAALHSSKPRTDKFWITMVTLLGHALHEVIKVLPDEPSKEMLS